jgi:hypothetical protein
VGFKKGDLVQLISVHFFELLSVVSTYHCLTYINKLTRSVSHTNVFYLALKRIVLHPN